MSYFMRRRQASVASRHRRLLETQKASPEKDGTARTNRRTRQGRVGPLRSTFSWDPDSFCSDTESSVVSSDVEKPLTPLSSVVVDLTGKCDHETEGLADVNPAQRHKDVVLLSSGEEDRIKRPELQKLRQSSLALLSVGKISLPLRSKAEDILETLRPKKGASGQKLIPDDTFTSLIESRGCFDSQLDDTHSEDSVVSGPSSPHSAPISLRCRECKRLFTKMRRQGPPKTKKRDHNPASLSCDEWFLIKTWHPQRRRQVKGRLWVHLKRIRTLAMQHLAAGVTNTTWVPCSRPHVFLQRNLRCCRRMSSMLGGSSDSKAKTHLRRRHRTKNLWPPLGAKKRNKKKSLEKDGTSRHLLTLDLTVSDNSSEDKPANEDTHRTLLPKQGEVLSGKSGCLDKQGGCDDLEGTRRVLKFDDPLNALPVETQRPMQGLVRKGAGRKLHKGQADFRVKDWDRSRAGNMLCEDLNEFRTPPDLSIVESKIAGKSHPSLFSSGHSSNGVQRGSFRSMLAAFEKSHNRIIKESHN
ncbi:uncharacterized protein [Salminus brasiliensis]|uniref:uncharacterized protein n=1 Tax=Salminus brasiliensis TaxID=930266 RepID=UPI003B83544B